MSEIDFENRLGLQIGLFSDRQHALSFSYPRLEKAGRQPIVEYWNGGITDRQTRDVSRTSVPRAAILIEAPVADILSLPRNLWKTASGQPEQEFCLEQLAPGNLPSDGNAGGLVISAMDVHPQIEHEFNEWYDEEHIPLLLNVPGMLQARRYRAIAGVPSYLAIYHLESAAAYKEQAWVDANRTPWIRRIHRHRLRTLHMMFSRSGPPG